MYRPGWTGEDRSVVSNPLLSKTDIASQAREAAGDAAARAGVQVRPLDAVGDVQAASRLIAKVWEDDGPAKAPPEFLRALAYAGNYVVGAFLDGAMVAASVAFLGLDGGPLKLHSHITCVRPDLQGRALGFAVKQDQRAWALARGINVIEWTTDPLVRRNGFFNLQKLGAEMIGYHVDFYGAMADGLNAGEESDRVVVRWNLRDERAVTASERRLEVPDASDGLAVILAEEGTDPAAPPRDSRAVRAWVPPDIVQMRKSSADGAHLWRKALRESFGVAIDVGFHARGMTRDGWYLLYR
jgi:predicted GNAT superfamily acetyltransferase